MSRNVVVELTNNLWIEVRKKERNHKFRPHCHGVSGHGKGRADVSIDLVTFEVLANSRFSQKDVKEIIRHAKMWRKELMAKWKEYHGK